MMTKQLQTQGLLRKGFMLGISLVLLVNVNPIFGQSGVEEHELSEVLVGDELRYVTVGGDYLWLATPTGVSRYHFGEKRWDFFTTKDGLISNAVNCIAVEWKEGILRKTPTERVWFGTDSGISVFDMKKNEWASYTVKDGLIENKIKCISARRDWIWAGTEHGASAFQQKKKRWRSYATFPGIKSPSVTAIYHDSRYAWIGTNSGLARYNYKHKQWEYFTDNTSFWISPEGGNRAVPNSPFLSRSIYGIQGSGDYVYIATGAGLVTSRKLFKSADLSREKSAYGVLKQPQRVAANARAMRSFNGLSQARQRALEGQRARAEMSFSRREKAAWIDLGWEVFQPSLVVRNREKREQISDQIQALAVSSRQVWMATNNGLLKFDAKTRNWDWYHQDMGLVSNELNSVAIKGNTIWIGTIHGLSKYSTFSRKWQNYRKEDPLPSANVLAIGEDVGAVWLATPKAVSRFNPDTERWKTYTHEDGLTDGRLSCIDVVGNYVWMGSAHGISRFDKSNTTWDYFRAAKSGLANDDITAILVDGKHIWVGTKRGLNRYDNTTGEWTVFSTRLGLSDNQITDLAADPQYVWVGTEKGLSRYSKAQERWEDISTLGETPILSVTGAGEKVCVSTAHGIYQYVQSKWTKVETNLTQVSDTIALDEGQLWMGGWRHLMRYDFASGQMRQFTEEDAQGLSRVRVHDIKPSSRYVWVATDGGIYRYNKADDTWWSYAPSRERGSTETLVHDNIKAIAVGGSEFVFVGTPSGISRYDKVVDSWLNYTPRDGLVHEYVSSLLWVDDELWVGTYGGVSRYNLVFDRWTNFTRADGLCDNRVTAMALAGNHLWFGTQKGVSRYDTKAKTWQTYTRDDGLPDNVVWAVAVDGSDLWFGTNSGAAKYTSSADEWQVYTTDDGLINNIVTSISVEKKYIFLTTPAGVTIYDKEINSLTPYSRADGLVASEAKSIGSKEKYHWMGTAEGITLYNQITDLSRNFTEVDGLPSNNVQVVAIDGDELWFGTDSGLARHHWIRGEWTTYSAAPTEAIASASELVSNNVKSVASDGDFLWVGTRLGLARYDKILHTWHLADLLRERTVDNTVKAVEEALQAIAPTKTKKIYVNYDPKVAEEKAIQAISNKVKGRTPMPSDLTVPSPFVKVRVKFPPTPSVRVIAPMPGRLWLGTEAGVIVYDKTTKAVKEIHPLLPWVRAIQYHQGKAWVLCDNQIAIYDWNDDTWTLISSERIVEHARSRNGSISEKLIIAPQDWGIDECTAMAILDKQIWLGRENGLKIYQIDSRKVRFDTEIDIPEYLQNAEITALGSYGGDVWIGTRNGLFQYRATIGEWKPYTILNGLAGNDISTIACGNKFIWVGTAGEGVSRYNKMTQKWDSFNIDDGLAGNNIRSITLDGKYVWMGTFSAGVCRYDLTTELWTTYRTTDNATLTSRN